MGETSLQGTVSFLKGNLQQNKKSRWFGSFLININPLLCKILYCRYKEGSLNPGIVKFYMFT